jgi:NAD(P)-dependent dehydrogenase (short-subunit alcohol dehydrogenase family)
VSDRQVLITGATRGTGKALAAPFGVTCNAVGACPIETKLTAAVPAAKIQSLSVGVKSIVRRRRKSAIDALFESRTPAVRRGVSVAFRTADGTPR